MRNNDKWCYYSLETLDPDNPEPTRRDFMQCQTCRSQSRDVYYHTAYWDRLQKCLRCGGADVKPVKVKRPRKSVVKKNRPQPFPPPEWITIFPFQEPLSGIRPINQLRRLWWLTADPTNAVAYGKQYGTDQAANLDWWLGCTLIYITGLFLTVSSLNIVTLQPLLYAGCVMAIFFVAWLINGVLGIHNSGWFLNLVGAALLGVVCALSIFSVLTGPFITFAILQNGFDVSISIAQDIAFRSDYIQTAGPALLTVIAIALGIIHQEPGYINIKSFVIYLAIVVVGALAIQSVPSTTREVIIGMLASIALPVVPFLFMRASRLSAWLTPFSAAIGLLLLIACGFTASAAASSFANLVAITATNLQTTL